LFYSGKTTIIESLKYVTTGDFPPNSKGGAFVYDPKLANEPEVKAQVKLRFKNVARTEMVCTRSLIVTQKDKKLTQKSLESLLYIRDPCTGVQYSISSKCAEIDKELPNHMGVSKPILENVIFCHQEDSFWPLAEPSVLKKKFDEIFAATGYTKALDNIRSIRKNAAIDLREMNANLRAEQNNKERAEKLEAELQTSKLNAERLQNRIDEFDGGKIDLLVEKMKFMMDKQKEFINLQNRYDQLILERDMLAKNCESLEGTITPLPGRDITLCRVDK
jgi:DNA repair protein RAD50